jgi:hypothetical protein
VLWIVIFCKGRRITMKKFYLLATIAVLLVGSKAVWADGNFYVIATGSGVGTRISSLPYMINTPGFYYVTDNLVCPPDKDGITINADNVTLDLMGFKISGPSGNWEKTGIVFGGNRTNVEIRNGTLTNWGDCIYEDQGLNIRVINVRVQAYSRGIYLGGDSHLVKGCQASYTIDAIFLGSGTVSGCTVIGDANTNIGIQVGWGVISGNHVVNCKTGINATFSGSIIGNYVLCNSGQSGIKCGANSYGGEIPENSLLDQNTVAGPGTRVSGPYVAGQNAGF